MQLYSNDTNDIQYALLQIGYTSRSYVHTHHNHLKCVVVWENSSTVIVAEFWETAKKPDFGQN